jgi:hypothetical protein
MEILFIVFVEMHFGDKVHQQGFLKFKPGCFARLDRSGGEGIAQNPGITASHHYTCKKQSKCGKAMRLDLRSFVPRKNSSGRAYCSGSKK